ncbi:MAG: hypothetical protein R3F44_20735 [Candidatus Competibacteraceae bacterium]
MLDFNTLNTRLAACQLPVVANPQALPEGVTLERIAHALEQAERGQNGARLYLQRQLSSRPAAALRPAATPNVNTAPTPTPTRSAAPRSEATPNADTAPASTPPPPTAPAPARSIAARPGATPARPDRVQCRVYGSKAALCIETDVTRQDEPTLRLEAAPATGPRAYDWPRKLTLQLTREELPVVAATVLGLLPRCTYKNHGPEQNKGLEIEHQGSHLFVRLFQKDRGVLAVPVGPADSYALAALALRALRQGTPWLSDQGILMALKLTVQRMSAAQNVKQ